ncbi:condensation domain-containing protein [Williamsia sp. 1135]|uniref:condensation domain-containing protein n=1 Tax=Williamsia sp. 1135 TaxID=1889262 RepID=UPI00117EA94F|nr:condensation domain-containing protein [Williamsia sp. 1135]
MSARMALSGAQRGVWFAQQLEPESPVFSVGQLVWLPSDVDADLVASAVSIATGEADVLRCRFEDGDAGPVQIVGAPTDEVAVSVVHFGGTPDQLRGEARSRMAVPIALSANLMYDNTVWTLAGGGVAWEFKAHHIMLDAYGVSLLTRRVAQVYTALAQCREIPASKAGTVAEVVALEATYENGPSAEVDRVYWEGVLAARTDDDSELVTATPALALPIQASVSIDREVINRIGELGKAVGASWGDAAIAVWSWYNAARQGKTAASIALPMMGRRGVALLTPMMLVNMLPLHLEASPDDTVGDWLARVVAAMKDVRKHQRYRGERLATASGGRKAALPQLNPKVFDYDLDFAGARGVPESLAIGPVDDLDLFIYNDNVHGFVLELHARADRYSTSDVSIHLRRLGLSE